jgi:hypothetical protein
MSDWDGDSPFFLIFEPAAVGEGNVGIDLDTAGWIETNKPYFRAPGTWSLCSKVKMVPLLSVILEEGDQFYFTKRHTGKAGGAVGEIVSYGIGKKMVGGATVNLWLLPNGAVCGGDDVDTLALRMI